MEQFVPAIWISGMLAALGAIIYAVGDSFLLSARADIASYPNLQPYEKLLSGTERMAGLPWWRLSWGGLLGVFATPLLLAGFWQVYQGLLPAGIGLALPPALMFVWASVVGAFVHGSFIYLGEYVQALNCVDASSQPVMIGMFQRHRKIMMLAYGFLLTCVSIASIWFSMLILLEKTAFPRWMAAVNPLTAYLFWVVLKKILPSRLTAPTEGAGFNIAYLIFFILTTVGLVSAA